MRLHTFSTVVFNTNKCFKKISYYYDDPHIIIVYHGYK